MLRGVGQPCPCPGHMLQGPSYPCLLRNLMAHTFPPLHTRYLAGGAFHSPHLSHPSPKSLPALPCLSGAVYAWLLKAQPTAASFLLQPWYPPTQRTRSSQGYVGSFRICLLLHLTSAQLSLGNRYSHPLAGKTEALRADATVSQAQ